MEGLGDLMATFEGVGLSRGTMNGTPLSVVASMDGGYRVHAGQEQFLKDLRAYELRKGKRRSWRDSMAMQIRACVAESKSKKNAGN
jgi:hypothetical protein